MARRLGIVPHMSKKPVLVTGGAGFVGRHTVRTLINRGEKDVWIIDDLSTGVSPSVWLAPEWECSSEHGVEKYRAGGATITFIQTDALRFFRDQAEGKGSVALPDFGDVFHFAAVVVGRELMERDTLLIAGDLAIDSAFFLWMTRKPGRVGRVLYPSSPAAYPVKLQGAADSYPMTEKDIDFDSLVLGVPDLTYGWTKLTGEFLAKLAHERYGIHIACIRPFGGYGEDQELTYPTPAIALRVARGDSPVEIWGTGEQTRDFIHVDDVVDAFFPILDRVKDGSAVNIGTGIATSFKTLALRLLALEGRRAPLKTLEDKPMGVVTRYADTTKLFKEIGWRPKISLDEGLGRVLKAAHERLSGATLPGFAVTVPPTAPDKVPGLDAAIVTTTINVPTLFDAYAADAKAHGRRVRFVVVADKKTPLEAETYCKELQQRTGYEVDYFTIERQEEYLKRFPALRDFFPYNCIQRRMIGLLFAYEIGSPVIITIDDDNFLADKDYFGQHAVGHAKEMRLARSGSGWLNVCALLEEKDGRPFFARGFPVEERRTNEQWQFATGIVRPVVNAGLWLGDPDIDALERLSHFPEPLDAVGYRGEEQLAVAQGTWTPFNSQNTALLREVIPAYMLVPHVKRMDDIWASYIIKRIADHKGDSITVGRPLVKQDRNPHNYWRDLEDEKGQALTVRFVDMLKNISLSGTSYQDCFKEIVEGLARAVETRQDLSQSERAFMQEFVKGLRVWVETCRTLG